MEGFLQLLLNGTALGSIYALVALGYTMVYGILRLINFAHGDIVMVGAYTGLFTALALKASDHPTPLNFLLVLFSAMLVSALLGYLIERLAYRPLRNVPRLNLLITAVGVSLLLENSGQVVFGTTPRVFPDIMPSVTFFQFGQVAVTNQQVTVFGTSLFLMFALEWIVLKTKLGRAMRAVSFSHETASLVGNPHGPNYHHHLYLRVRPGGCGRNTGGNSLSPGGSPDGGDDRNQGFCGRSPGGHRQHPRERWWWISHGNLRGKLVGQRGEADRLARRNWFSTIRSPE